MEIACVNFTRSAHVWDYTPKILCCWRHLCRVPSSVCDWLFFGFEFSHAFIDQSEGTVELRHQYGIFRRFSGVSSARKDFRASRQNSVSRDYMNVKGKIAESCIILVQLFL